MVDSKAFISRLLRDVPELVEVEVGQSAAFAEVIPHVFMGDLTRFVVAAHERALAGSTDAEQLLDRILRILEEGVRSGGQDTQELIAASFLENLDHGTVAFLDLRERLGPSLSAKLRSMSE